MKQIICLAALSFIPTLVLAQAKPGEAATIKGVEIKGDAKPGATVTAVVKVELAKSYHAHSNKPSESSYIPTVIAVNVPKGVKAGSIKYPAGKSLKVEVIDKPLSIYEDEFEVSVPLTLGRDAALPLTIPATLSYQACKGAVCYPPKKVKFDIVVGAAKRP